MRIAGNFKTYPRRLLGPSYPNNQSTTREARPTIPLQTIRSLHEAIAKKVRDTEDGYDLDPFGSSPFVREGLDGSRNPIEVYGGKLRFRHWIEKAFEKRGFTSGPVVWGESGKTSRLSTLQELFLREYQRTSTRPSASFWKKLDAATYADFRCTLRWFFYPLVRLQDCLFIDALTFNGLETRLRQQCAPFSFLIPEMGLNILGLHDELKKYTLAVLAILQQMSPIPEVIVDAGSGDGALSLGALWWGGRHAFAIDIDTAALARAKKTFRQNPKPLRNRSFTPLEIDIRNRGEIEKALPKQGNGALLISNIGDWKQYGGISNRTAMELIPALRERYGEVSLLVGGYRNLSGHEFHFDMAHARKQFGLSRVRMSADVHGAQAFLLEP